MGASIIQERATGLQKLLWTKNIKPVQDWAYLNFRAGELFKLAWKKNESNASKPEREDLILLRQHGLVTHLVKVLDYKPEREKGSGDWNIYRVVEVIWSSANSESSTYKADEIFGYPEVLTYQGGSVMRLQELPTFNKAWSTKGGISGFQDRIASLLLSSELAS